MGIASIFVNYRNGEHSPLVNELYEQLAHHFGVDQVFLDRYTIRPGGRYPNELRDGVAHADVLISVVHPEWPTQRDETGVRLLDRERDWVREELEIALPDMTTTVIALLVDDAERLRAEDLPAAIAELALRQSLRIHGDTMADDVATLIGELELHVAPSWSPGGPPPRRARTPWSLAATATLILLVLPSLLVLHRQPGSGVPLSFVVALGSTVLMAIRLAAGVLVLPMRGGVNSLERVAHSMAPTPYYRRIGIPGVMVLLLFVGLTTVGAEAANHVSNVMIYLTAAVGAVTIVASIAAAAVRAAQEEKTDEQRFRNWPQSLPLPPDPARLRREIGTLDDRMYGWRVPLTREQRDKSAWALAELRGYQADMVRRADLGLRSWLVTDHPVLLVRYLLWTAGTYGLLLAAVLPRMPHGRVVADLVGGAVILAVLAIGVLYVDRAQARNRVRMTHADTSESLDRLSGRLAELTARSDVPS